MRTIVALAAVLLGGLLAGSGRADDEAPRDEAPRALDTHRFYIFIDNGEAFQLNNHFADDINLDAPDGANWILGGGAGYNFTDHWGIELHAHGTEPDVKSESRGKEQELSNITLLPAVRFRYPLEDRRWVPYVTAGLGYSVSDLNDTGNPRIKHTMDETSIVGSIAVGFEYFVTPNVGLGLAAQSFIYPDASTHVEIRGRGNQITFEDDSSVNLSSIALIAQIRLYPGQAAEPATEDHPAKPRRWLFADEGPFDTDDVRFYLYALGGNTFIFDQDFGPNVRLESPGGFNATIGGGMGLNLSRHWGVEFQAFNAEPNVRETDAGKFTELSMTTFLAGIRYRYPFLGGRLVPFATAGAGRIRYNFTDTRAVTDVFDQGSLPTPKVAITSAGAAGSVGVGVEYFLNHHVSFGVAVPFYIYSDVTTRVQRVARDGTLLAPVRETQNYSGFAPMIRITAYMP